MNPETTDQTVAVPSASFHPEPSRSPREIPHILRSAMEVRFLQTVLMRGRRSACGCYGKSNFDSVQSVQSVAKIPFLLLSNLWLPLPHLLRLMERFPRVYQKAGLKTAQKVSRVWRVGWKSPGWHLCRMAIPKHMEFRRSDIFELE
jgi:hypothetical protein